MKRIILLVAVVFAISSCEKFVQIDAAPNLIVEQKVFADSAGASSAVIGVYLALSQGSPTLQTFNGNVSFTTGLSGDELYSTRTAIDDQLAYTGSFLVTSNTPGSFWGQSFDAIYKANVCIEGITKSSTINPSLKNQLIGECLTIRSLVYFNLINLFGPVPFVTTTDFEVNARLPRESIEKVLNNIESDLKKAYSLLPDKYPSAGRVRVNKAVASALLTRVYLYTKKWNEAEQEATAIISNTDYILETNLNQVFLSGSKEQIWQLLPISPGYNTAEGFFFVPANSSAIPRAGLSSFLLSDFETGDARAIEGNWIKSVTINSKKYTYPFKYKLGQDGSSAPKEYYSAIRKSEMYLIRAEARMNNGKIQGAGSAEEDLNVIRRRGGLTDTTAANKDDMLKLILRERRVELFCEWGHRWFDLKRTNKIDEVLTPVYTAKGSTWDTNKKLYPVPFSERQTNSNLSQNPGYQ